MVDSEGELWQLFQQGDRLAFGRIYQIYVNDLFNYGMKIVNNRDLVKDCIQELFLELWQSRKRLAKVNNVKFYLIKALRWKIIHYKKKPNSIYNISPYEQLNTQLTEVSYEHKIIEAQTENTTLESLSEAFKKLPTRQRG